MPTVQVSTRLDEEIKDKIDALVNQGRYRSVTDFVIQAILHELESGRVASEEWLRAQAARAVRDDLIAGRYDDLIEKRVRAVLANMAGPTTSTKV